MEQMFAEDTGVRGVKRGALQNGLSACPPHERALAHPCRGESRRANSLFEINRRTQSAVRPVVLSRVEPPGRRPTLPPSPSSDRRLRWEGPDTAGFVFALRLPTGVERAVVRRVQPLCRAPLCRFRESSARARAQAPRSGVRGRLYPPY